MAAPEQPPLRGLTRRQFARKYEPGEEKDSALDAFDRARKGEDEGTIKSDYQNEDPIIQGAANEGYTYGSIPVDPVLIAGEPTDHTPHTVKWSPHDPTATKIAPGVTLTTLDGAKVGNGIIVREITTDKMNPFAVKGGLPEYLESTGQKLWLVETDFGNRMTLSTNEVHEFYGLGYQQDYETWWDERLQTIQKTVE